MKTNANLIEGKKKTIPKKNNYSINGFLWNERQLNNNEVVILKNELGLEDLYCKTSSFKGINSKNFKNFMDTKIKTTLPDPFVLDDMEKATKKIVDCILKNKKLEFLEIMTLMDQAQLL